MINEEKCNESVTITIPEVARCERADSMLSTAKEEINNNYKTHRKCTPEGAEDNSSPADPMLVTVEKTA